MPVHKLLRGEGAERYLPFALARARAMRARIGPKGYATEKFNVEGTSIEIQQEAQFQYVRIVAGAGLCYEFFASEQGGASLPTYLEGSALRTKFLSSTPLYSTALTPDPTTPRWKARLANLPQSADTGLYTWKSWQNQKYFEHCWHPNNDGKSLVTSTQCQAPGLGNKCGWNSPYFAPRLPNVGAFTADYGLDVAPTKYSGASVSSAAPALERTWQYWRRAAVQGKFWISTDNFGRFQIYRVGTYPGDLVPSTQYQTITPPYPAWVTVPDPLVPTKDSNDWLWRFNKDGTKCVSVPFHSEPSGFYKYARASFCAVLPEEVAALTPASAVYLGQDDTPGLVEFGIVITETGSGPLDFEVTFSLLSSSYFGDDQKFYFDAAYFMKDVEAIGVAEDTLITAEIECKTPAGMYHAGPVSNAHCTDAVDAVDALDSYVVLRAAGVEKLRFPAFGVKQFQFPTLTGRRAGARNDVSQFLPLAAGGTGEYHAAGPVSFNPLAGTYGTTLAFIFSLELSTLSILYEVNNQLTAAGYIRGMACGTEFYRTDYVYGTVKLNPGYAAASVPVPSARVHQYILAQTLNTEWGQGFSVHPHGHWAHSTTAELTQLGWADPLDWISVRKKSDGTRTRYRHKTLFNSAFDQARDYSFYAAAYPYEHGSFRTAGFWVTFR